MASRSTTLQLATVNEVSTPLATPLQPVKKPSGRDPPSMQQIVRVSGARAEDGDDLARVHGGGEEERPKLFRRE